GSLQLNRPHRIGDLHYFMELAHVVDGNFQRRTGLYRDVGYVDGTEAFLFYLEVISACYQRHAQDTAEVGRALEANVGAGNNEGDPGKGNRGFSFVSDREHKLGWRGVDVMGMGACGRSSIGSGVIHFAVR